MKSLYQLKSEKIINKAQKTFKSMVLNSQVFAV